jgi:hypothetical protein
VRHGVVKLGFDDLDVVGSTMDLYCRLELSDADERATTPFRLRARVV